MSEQIQQKKSRFQISRECQDEFVKSIAQSMLELGSRGEKWKPGWSGEQAMGMPFCPVTGREYSGANLIKLMLTAKFMELRGKEGLGYGDAKLMAMLGALSGFQAVPLIQLCAVITAFLFAILTRKTNSPFAFGPWLCLGFLMQILTDVRISV